LGFLLFSLRRGLLAWAKTTSSSPAHTCSIRHPKPNNISTISN